MTLTEMEIPEIESEQVVQKNIVEVPLLIFYLLTLFVVLSTLSWITVFTKLEDINWKLNVQAEKQAWIWETMAPGMFSRLDQIIKDSALRNDTITESIKVLHDKVKRIPAETMHKINLEKRCAQKTKWDKDLMDMCLDYNN